MRSSARCRGVSTAGIALWLCLQSPGLLPAQPPENAEGAAEAPANPRADLLKRVLGGKAGSADPAANTEGTPAVDGDPLDRQVNSSSTEARYLAHAEQAIAAEDWQAAVQLLQAVLDRPQDSLWPRPDGAGVSMQSEAEARIGRLPAAGQTVYRAEFGGLAGQLLQRATGPDALSGAALVANRYFHTDAGKQATAMVAALLFDRGEYRASAAWYTRLVNEPAYRDATDWRARATYALVQAGDRQLAESLLETLAQQPAGALVGPADSEDTLAAWILKQPTGQAPTPELRDWLTLYGNAAHVGAAPPCVPLLLQRWSQPLTARYALEQQLRGLLLDLQDNQRAAIPSMLPIVAGGRVAFRTFRGLAVVDARTGRLQWESDPGISAERLLANEPPQGTDSAFEFSGAMAEYGETHFEQHPLTNLLFRDAGYGLLSSDGERVFSIENSVLMPPSSLGYWWGGNSPASQDPYQRDWTSNQIHAYDLATGERLWEAGGRRMQEPFDPPLAGAFFFGPPVADGGELYAIGERDGEILLFALAPSTGELLWSQSLAEAGAVVEQDLVRRLWTCTPAVDAGLVICPTTAGWLVAVDRHTHRIAWAHWYPERTTQTVSSSGPSIHSMQPLNDRWCATAPILAGGAVVFAPPEQPDEAGQDQPRLICLDSRTGAPRWQRPKGNALYPAGVFGGQVVLVGRDEVLSLKLEDGQVAWTLPVPADDGPPSGRGIAVGGQLLLPLESGQLWTIDLAAGQLAQQSRLPGAPTAAPLGNLVVWEGMLLSLGPFGLVGFEQREPLQQEIAARFKADPQDVWAAVRQAEIHLVSGDHVAALQALDRAPSDAHAADPGLAERRRRLTYSALLALLRESSEDRPAEFERAAALAVGDDERLELDRLRVDRHIAAGRWMNAVELCQQNGAQIANDRMIDDGLTSVRLDVWLGGRLADIAAQAPPPVAEALAERVAATLESSSVAFPAAASLERMYGFHPAAQSFLWRLIEDAAYRKDFAGAEVRLRRLIEDGDRTTTAAALARLGDLLLEFNQPADAAVAFARLEAEFGDTLLPSLQTGAETARHRFSTGALDRAELQPPAVADWTREQFNVRHFRVVNADYTTPQLPVTRRLDAEFFRRHFIEFDPQSPVMSVQRRSDNGAYWRLPLRMTDSQVYNQSAAVVGQGLQMIVLHRGMVHAISLPDRRVLWSQPVAERGPGMYTRHIYDSEVPSLQPAGGFSARAALTNLQPQTGMLALATSRYVACHGRGEFVMLDPLTGDVLWRRRGVSPQTGLHGDAQTVYVVPQDADKAYALRAADGHPVSIEELPSLIKNTIAVTASGFVRIDRKAGGRASGAPTPKLTIAAFDPLRRTSAWSHEFAARSRLTFIDDRELLVLDEVSGACALLELETGRRQQLGDVPASALRQSSEMFAVADAQQVYLILNDAGNNFNNYIHPPALRVSGAVVALARDGAGIAWQQTVANQNLLLPRFEQSPLLVFLAYDHVHVADIEADYANARLLVLDKGDGHTVAEDTRASPNGNYYRIDLLRAERAIDIHSHNERVRIQAVPRDAPAGGG